MGFYFLDLATDYKPADDLSKFLSAGPPPVYIGYGLIAHVASQLHLICFISFGSVVVMDPKAMTGTGV